MTAGKRKVIGLTIIDKYVWRNLTFKDSAVLFAASDVSSSDNPFERRGYTDSQKQIM